MTACASFSSLPQELLYHIIEYLDSDAPSQGRAKSEPSPILDIISRPNSSLKSVSQVSRRLRKTAIPLLYKAACLVVKPTINRHTSYQKAIGPLLKFIDLHHLQPCIRTFTLCIENWDSCCQNNDDDVIDGLVEIKDFWEAFFDAIDPACLTIVASPCALGHLTGCDIWSEDAWLFDIKYQILQLSYPKYGATPFRLATKASAEFTNPSAVADSPAQSTSSPIDQCPNPRHPTLFAAKPWTSLLLNEGSFIKAFHAYEYYHKRPPSLLPSLLGISGDTFIPTAPLFPSTIRSFSYIAVFPIQSHFQLITLGIPKLSSFFMQIVPSSENNILDDRGQMQRIDVNDLWMERNHCYAMVMRELFNTPSGGKWGFLSEFESGDAADEDAWTLAVGFVERVGGWKVERPGVFIKVAENRTGVNDASAFSSLRRWAFNGVRRLPVSSLDLYIG